MTVPFAKVSISSVLFGLLAVVPAAVADTITAIPLPNAGYTGSTTLIPITGNDGDTQTTLAAFRPFQAAWMSDFRGNRADVLSLAEGRAQIDLGPNGWVQIEAEW